MKVQEIYEKYRIPPWLQEHQLRVAAVGHIAAESLQGACDARRVVTACLLHDMGSIVKFNFADRGTLSDLCPDNDVPHWIEVQKEFREKYGTEEHPATDAVLAEIGGLDDIRAIVDLTGYSHMREIIVQNNIDVMVVQYADMRVGPYGILPLEKRIRDVQKRYADILRETGRYELMDEYLAMANEIEAILFKDARTRPESITDASVASLIEELRNFPVA